MTAGRSALTRRRRRWTSTRSSTRSTTARARVSRDVIRGFGDQYDGKGEQAREATQYFSPFLVSGSDLTRELALDQKVLERFVTDTSDAVTAIAERRDDLADLVSNANTAFGAIGAESVALDRALELLPDTLRKANTTFVNLRSTLDDLEQLVDVSKPATRRLAPVPARAAPARPRRPPDDRRPQHARAQPGQEQRPDRADREAAAPRRADRIGLPARDQHARPRPAGVRVRAQLHAGPGGLGHQLRPAGRQLRRQRPLRARAADVPAVQLSRTAH